MNSKFCPRFLLLFSLIAFCLPAPKFLLLETENNGEDAGGGEAAEQTRDETWPQVDFDFIFNFASFSCHSVDFVHKPTSFSLSVMRGNPLPNIKGQVFWVKKSLSFCSPRKFGEIFFGPRAGLVGIPFFIMKSSLSIGGKGVPALQTKSVVKLWSLTGFFG